MHLLLQNGEERCSLRILKKFWGSYPHWKLKDRKIITSNKWDVSFIGPDVILHKGKEKGNKKCMIELKI